MISEGKKEKYGTQLMVEFFAYASLVIRRRVCYDIGN